MSSVQLVSAQRLDTFRNFAGDDQRALELHNLTLQVGSTMMAIIALIELSLRNLADTRIAEDLGQLEWLQKPTVGLELDDQERRAIKLAIQHAQKAEYSKLTHAGKKELDAKIYPHGVPPNIKHDTLSKKRWETFEVSHGQVVAQTTIFFWKRLFSSDYENALWKRSLKKLFPQKSVARADVARHLEVLYSARNRIAHHEPVYGERLDQAFEAVKFLRENLLRGKTDSSTVFLEFTEIQFHRLYIDFTAFKRSWALLTM
jgi:hypothetical protein